MRRLSALLSNGQDPSNGLYEFLDRADNLYPRKSWRLSASYRSQPVTTMTIHWKHKSFLSWALLPAVSPILRIILIPLIFAPAPSLWAASVRDVDSTQAQELKGFA